MGCEVHLAANFKNDRGRDYFSYFEERQVITHQIDFNRSPFSAGNIKCIKQLDDILKSCSFDLVHCHTPVGGVLGRLVSQKYRKQGCKVIYTVHGLQFCKGESLKNWIIYYPVEKIMSLMADVIITINQEDYRRVKKSFWNKHTTYIPGVGINLDKVRETSVDRKKKRASLGFTDDDIILFHSGEHSIRKNQKTLIEALSILKNPKVHLVLAGDGSLKNYHQELADQACLHDQVHIIGFRTDIYELLKSSDIFLFPSIHEGLGISLLEAMACGLPCVATEVQGIKDLIKNKENLCAWNDADAFARRIKFYIDHPEESKSEGNANYKNAHNFEVKKVEPIMKNLYSKVLKGPKRK